jgi:hypothetical protein
MIPAWRPVSGLRGPAFFHPYLSPRYRDDVADREFPAASVLGLTVDANLAGENQGLRIAAAAHHSRGF